MQGILNDSNSSGVQYNFLEKKEHNLYKSMQKTVKSDTEDIEGQNDLSDGKLRT